MKKFIRIVLVLAALIAILWRVSIVNASAAEAPTDWVANIDFSSKEGIEFFVDSFDDPLFKQIAWCESKFKPSAKNMSGVSNAEGVFQFLTSTFNNYGKQFWGDELKNKSKFNGRDNVELAWYVYTHYGTVDWEADPKSKNCWKGSNPQAKFKNIY